MVTLTKQIIQEVVDKSVTTALRDTNGRIGNVESRLASVDEKLSTMLGQLSDIAGQFRKFDWLSFCLKRPHVKIETTH